MKTKNLLKVLMVSICCLSMFTFTSCLDENDSIPVYYPNALVTVKHTDNNTFYLQLDDSTTLFPTNIEKSPFGEKEVRALVNFTEVENESNEFTKSVKINWIDSILTKPTVPNFGEKNDSVYGMDPVEIVNDWVTIAEDSYLTLRFRTYWRDYGRPHHVNLVAGVNANNPYELEFRHNAHGETWGRLGDALVAFNLKDLPDTNGKTVKLKLNWMSFSGKKSVEFNYCTGKKIEGAIIKSYENNFINEIK